MITFLLIKHILIQSPLPLQSLCRFSVLFVTPEYLAVCVIGICGFHNPYLYSVHMLYILTCKNLVVCVVVINRSLHSHIHSLFENKLMLCISIAKIGDSKARKC